MCVDSSVLQSDVYTQVRRHATTLMLLSIYLDGKMISNPFKVEDRRMGREKEECNLMGTKLELEEGRERNSVEGRVHCERGRGGPSLHG